MNRGPLAIFAYGSLVDPSSAELTLGREVTALTSVRLGGWRRRWSIARDNQRFEKTFAAADGTVPEWILGLNIEPDLVPGVSEGANGTLEGPNGALIEVSPVELGHLDRREMRYRRVEVTGHVENRHPFSVVYAYTARQECLRPAPPEGSVILRRYVETVEKAFARLGPEDLDSYRRTTARPPVRIVDAELIRDKIPEGNPREW